MPIQGKPVLVARAAEARDVLPDALRERGAEVDVVALYETVRETPSPEEIEAAMAADYVTFTSSSTVKNFLEVTGGRMPDGARIVSIGPVTSETAREAGLDVAVEAQQHDPEGVVRALVEQLRAARRGIGLTAAACALIARRRGPGLGGAELQLQRGSGTPHGALERLRGGRRSAA